ncbi:MAG: FAD-binding oxidoreductase [Candidatus Dadabacteria bacterium]|nr:MAG: FAD-binding oxidoreductase [Candidatus Dadabacteria bacterium]
MSEFSCWGRYPHAQQTAYKLSWRDQVYTVISSENSVLPYGQGRSYGDVCLNDGGALLVSGSIDRIIEFDRHQGIIRAEAGLTLEELLRVVVPAGWFLPVTPGTRFVSLGGAVANDVHGKNHHRHGTFGSHIKRFALLRSDKNVYECSPEKEIDLFRATIAGLGLTGFILWVELQLIPIEDSCIRMESIKFNSLSEFFEISDSSNQDYQYTVAWIDCLKQGAGFGRGIFMRGNHASAAEGKGLKVYEKTLPAVPFDMPEWMLNRYTVGAFNALYFRKQLRDSVTKIVPYDTFFYPLDAVARWNRIYGRSGFMQFQSVCSRDVIERILQITAASGQASFLAVIKEFGDIKSPGMLSFPRPGITLCMDFPNRGASTLKLLRELEELVCSRGGALYPAKDAVMSERSFKDCYPSWQEFMEYKDPKFSSSFWRRVTGER